MIKMFRIENIIDPFQKEEYIFYFDESRHILFLDNYKYYKRETKRHKFKPIKHYDRIRVGGSWYDGMKEEDVPFTEEIKQRAIDEFASRLAIKRWSERDNCN